MQIWQFFKTVYRTSFLAKCGAKISQAYAGSKIFSLHRAGELDDVLGESVAICEHENTKKSTKGKILPALKACAETLTCISCRDFALLLVFFLVSASISGWIDGNLLQGIACVVGLLAIIPLLFSKNAFLSVFSKSLIGRFFELKYDITVKKQHISLLILIGTLAIVGGMFLPFPFAILLPLFPVVFLLFFDLKPIFFISLIMLCLPIFGTSVCIVLCVLLILSQWLQRFYGTVQKTKLDYLDIILSVYIVLCLISSLFSFVVADSLRVSLMWVSLFSAVFIMIRNITTVRDLIVVLSWLMIGTVIASVIGLYQYLSGQIDTTWTDTSLFEDLNIRIYSTFANPNVFGEFLLLVIPFAAGLGIYLKKWKYKIASFAVLGLSLVALALTYSRGCYVGIAVTVVVFLLMYNKKILGVLLVVGTPIGITMLPQNMIDRILSMVNLADSSTSYRLKIYEGSFELLRTYWPSGLGIGEAAFNYVYPFFGIQGIVAPHTHSLFLQLMTSFGIAGLLYFIFLMFVYHRNVISSAAHLNKNDDRKILLIVFGSVLFGFLVQSIFDYTWYNYRVYFLFWIVVALGFATYKMMRREGVNCD